MDPTNFVDDCPKPLGAPTPQEVHVQAFSPNTLLITPPVTGPRNPTFFICVLDVSGSMGTMAAGATQADKPDVNFSRLDLVKHSMNTLIAGLEADDHLAIIPFSSEAHAALVETRMTEEGKKNASSAVADLQAYGGTNIWAGVNLALLLASRNRNKNPIILLLTDGEPNIDPPRGLVPTITTTMTSLGLHVPIHTFGFGYDMNSALIGQVANVTSATYAFIPDCSMVGTVFINFIATALATISHTMQLQIGTGPVQQLGAIQYGQPRLVHLPTPLTEGSAYSLQVGTTQIQATIVPSPPTPELTFKQEWLLQLNEYEKLAKAGNFDAALTLLEELHAHVPASMPDYATDLKSADDNEGQIGKAAQKAEWWQRWGRHYLPSVICAHKYQVCNNFKDKAIQGFGGQMFREHQARLEQLFLTISPPVVKIAPVITRAAAHARANGNLSTFSARVPSVDMSYYHNLGGGCFAGSCRVETPEGTKLVRDVKKGDILVTKRECGYEYTAAVVCVVVSKPPGGKMDIVTIDSLKITPWHPIKFNQDSQWVFPAEAYDATQGSRNTDEQIDEVYTFVMDDHHTFIVEGFTVCGLGHGLKGPVIGHDYFGTDKIINDLKQLQGWEEGRVLYNHLKTLSPEP